MASTSVSTHAMTTDITTMSFPLGVVEDAVAPCIAVLMAVIEIPASILVVAIEKLVAMVMLEVNVISVEVILSTGITLDSKYT